MICFTFTRNRAFFLVQHIYYRAYNLQDECFQNVMLKKLVVRWFLVGKNNFQSSQYMQLVTLFPISISTDAKAQNRIFLISWKLLVQHYMMIKYFSIVISHMTMHYDYVLYYILHMYSDSLLQNIGWERKRRESNKIEWTNEHVYCMSFPHTKFHC